MSQTRVYVDIVANGHTYVIITSEDQVEELLEAWKNKAPGVHSITGTVDHRDANTCTHYFETEDINTISVQELNL